MLHCETLNGKLARESEDTDSPANLDCRLFKIEAVTRASGLWRFGLCVCVMPAHRCSVHKEGVKVHKDPSGLFGIGLLI